MLSSNFCSMQIPSSFIPSFVPEIYYRSVFLIPSLEIIAYSVIRCLDHQKVGKSSVASFTVVGNLRNIVTILQHVQTTRPFTKTFSWLNKFI